ncbi:hypothetical protein CRUP_026338 [Coryphaenoides rupestris]|nr:hypothetical protein CRUP_026338 [Coryphaenoides rupestris]
MIVCVMPDSWPIMDYMDYGCYCGLGGSGTPVDDLDREGTMTTPVWHVHARHCSALLLLPRLPAVFGFRGDIVPGRLEARRASTTH